MYTNSEAKKTKQNSQPYPLKNITGCNAWDNQEMHTVFYSKHVKA